MVHPVATRMTATTYEPEGALSERAVRNARALRAAGVTVLHGVDATRLEMAYPLSRFDVILFLFPHTGSREPVGGRNSNHVLLRRFLHCACQRLHVGGKIMITVVDSPHYEGAFQAVEAADKAGCLPPVALRFDPGDYFGYAHTNTKDDQDALEGHDTFKLIVFAQKNHHRPMPLLTCDPPMQFAGGDAARGRGFWVARLPDGRTAGPWDIG